jgi:thiosulfate/3-mercaptopyruvate sulfurtransferase
MARFVLRGLVAFSAAVVLSADAQPSSMLVNVAELAGMMDDPSLVVLHVSNRESAFQEAHIPGARFVRSADFAVEGADKVGSELPPADVIKRVFEGAGVSDNSRVVIYEQGTVLAARAFFTLDVFGHPRVAMLDGGLNAWRAAGNPVERGAAKAGRPGSFTPRLNAARLADAAFIQKQVPGETVALVDVRPDAEYYGTDGGMQGMHAPGHIAGAKQLTWNALVGSDGRFLPREELRTKLQGAGVAPGRPAVAYCMVGLRASVVYFVARYLGYDVKLYDGSVVDWSRRGLELRTKN